MFKMTDTDLLTDIVDSEKRCNLVVFFFFSSFCFYICMCSCKLICICMYIICPSFS